MITIPQVVQEILRELPFVEEALGEGIINHSALARKILPEVQSRLKKEVQEGAVIMAIKRMPITLDKLLTFKLTKLIESLGDITVRSNLSDFTFFNSSTLRKAERTLIDYLNETGEDFYTISRGVYETTIIVSSIVKQKVDEIFDIEKLISSTDKLSSITIRLPEENLTIPGLYYSIFKRLAEGGINIIEIVSTANEITIIVTNADVEKAFVAIKSL